MSDTAWYAASLAEAKAFLDQLADAEEIPVHRESDIVAALLGLMTAAPIVYTAAQHAANVTDTLALLEAVPVSRAGSPSPEEQED